MIPTIRPIKSTDTIKEESSNLLNEKQNGYLGIANKFTKSDLDKLDNLSDDTNLQVSQYNLNNCFGDLNNLLS